MLLVGSPTQLLILFRKSGIAAGSRRSVGRIIQVPMAGFDGDVHIEVARSIRTAVESEGGHFRPFGEFRKRLAAAGIRVSSTIASRLWRAVDDSAEISADEE